MSKMKRVIPPILRLDQEVINRIAAGEIIQHPVNVVKELLENSIDAKAKRIDITIENGGYQMIKVKDNGTGIRTEDLPLAAARHTTSKIHEYNDLMKIATFGFRGEALFSMSCCSHLKITTKTEKDGIAYVASYIDGKLSGKIEPTSADQGTTVEIKDLFYNNKIRIDARPKTNVDSRKISEVVAKYSVVYPEVAFRLISNDKELYRSKGNSTFDNVLREMYGIENKRAFLNLMFQICGDVTCEVYLSHPSNTRPPRNNAIFINGRLVNSDRIHHGIEGVYQDILSRGSHPFYFIVLTMPPENVDVNIHPAKKEVRFLNEIEIISQITTNIQDTLSGLTSINANIVEPLPNSRSQSRKNTQELPENQTLITAYNSQVPHNQEELYQQNDSDIPSQENNSQNPGIDENHEYLNDDFDIPDVDTPIQQPHSPINLKDNTVNNSNITSNEIIPKPPQIIDYQNEERNFSPSRPIALPPDVSDKPEKHIKPTESPKKITNKQKSVFDELKYEPKTPHISDFFSQPKVISKSMRVVNLKSVLDLRADVENQKDPELKLFFENHQFVGFMGLSNILLKYNDELYICNTFALLKHYFYQRILSCFSNFSQVRLEPAVLINDCMEIMEVEYPGEYVDFFNDEAKQQILNEYFSISIHDGVLYSLPLVLSGYAPSYTALAYFLTQLIEDVDWEDEKECFHQIILQLASLYSVIPDDENDEVITSKLQHDIMTIILPEMKKEEFRPSHKLLVNGSIQKIPSFSCLEIITI